MKKNYQDIYDSSINNKEEFWENVAKDIFWYKKPTKILNSSNPPFYKWYEDGITNTCYNAVDVHVCLLYTSPSPRDKTVSRMPSSA